MAEIYTKEQIDLLTKEHDDGMDRVKKRGDVVSYFTLDYWKKIGNYILFKKFMSEDIKTILDIGCHIGFLDILYSQWGEEERNVTAIDISKRALDYAMAHNKQYKRNIKFRLGVFETMDFEEKYDLVILSHVIEHTYNPKIMIDKAIDLCNKRLMILTPVGEKTNDPTHKHHWFNFTELLKIIDLNKVRVVHQEIYKKEFHLVLEKI